MGFSRYTYRNDTEALDAAAEMIEELEAERDRLLSALIIGGRECAEIEFGKDHEHIDRLALGTWNNWLKEALEE